MPVLVLFCNSQLCFASGALPLDCAHNPMAARSHGSQGEGQAQGTFLLSLFTSKERSFCLKTHEVLVAMWLVTALAFSAPALQDGEHQSKGRNDIEQQRLLFRPLLFVLSVQSCCWSTLKVNSDLSVQQTVCV